MLVSDRCRFVFVHVQKTGGMSIEAFLRERVPDLRQVCSRHEHLRRVPRSVAEPWGDYFKFGFVRNPWDRLVSWYTMIEREYRALPGWRRTFQARPLRLAIWNLAVPYLHDFSAFVRGCTDEVFCEGCLKSFAYSQSEYLDGPDGRCGVDFVGRYERLPQDMAVVAERLGLPRGELPHENSSAHRHYSTYYDAATRAIVEERFRRDIESFGYHFEDGSRT